MEQNNISNIISIENNQINNKDDTKYNNKFENNLKNSKIDLILNQLKKTDKIKESLSKDIENLNKKSEEYKSFINKEINNLKEYNKNEINTFKNYLGNEINLIKEEILKIKNNNNTKIIDDNKNKKIIKDFDLMREDLKNLNEKYTNFERIFDNKLDFIESSLSKLLEINKKKNVENNLQNKNDINNELIDSHNTDKNDLKEFENQIDIIFSEQNDNCENINEEDLKQLEKISLKLIKNNILSLEIFSEYFKKKFGSKKCDECSNNFISKKVQIFEMLNNLDHKYCNKLKEKEQKEEKEEKKEIEENMGYDILENQYLWNYYY